jgi:type III secretion protein V
MPFAAINRFLALVSQRQDLLFIIFIMIFVMMFIIPVPVIVIDILIAFNMTFTLLVLISSTYMKNALELSTFPSIILFSTVFRLALTVATARLILSKGDAGAIIDSFGKFVVSGNLVVGLVVFFIVAIVQFIVVVKGAERIAEVSARFTLDAMPGKQMSIDSDLRAGDINKDEARKKRQTLEKESQMHGAMDGAMRFVKGDAIAGFVVIFVNLIGGISVGMALNGMSFSDAANKYSLLSVGDGLVAQIPAMFIAIAAGTVVTRVSTDESTSVGADMFRELGSQPKALSIAAFILALLGFLPGFPTSVFFTLSALLGGAAFLMYRTQALAAYNQAMGAMPQGMDGMGGQPGMEGFNDLGGVPLRGSQPGDVFSIVASPSLLQNMEEVGVGGLLSQKQQAMQMELGIPLPEIGFRPDPTFPQDVYRFDVEDVPVTRGRYDNQIVRIQAPEQELMQAGITPQLLENPQGIPEVWVPMDAAEQLSEQGYRLEAPAMAFADDVSHIMRRYVSRSFGLAEAQAWFGSLEQRYGRLVQDVQQSMPLFRIVEIMRILLDEGIPLGQARTILETLLVSASPELSPRDVADRIRGALKRQIVSRLADRSGSVHAIILGPDVEGELRNPSDSYGFGSATAPDTSAALENIRTALTTIFVRTRPNPPKTLLCSADIRSTIHQFIHDKGFDVHVLAHQDIPPGFDVQAAAFIQNNGAVFREDNAA